MASNIKRVKFACYAGNITQATTGNIPPLLFLTFHTLYGISYSLLGLLVLIFFFSQLGIDLVFSLFSHKFNIRKTVCLMPVLAILGLAIYALFPLFLPQYAYLGLVIGTVIFAVSSGLAEVLISPIIAALPSDNPEREMSKLHSIYAWGVVGVVLFCTVFLLLFQSESWHWMVLLCAAIPLVGAILFFTCELPTMETPQKISGVVEHLKKKELWLCVFAIFLGGASECTMAQWSSSYLEQALGIPKIWGDVFGVALFGFTLGLGRTLYAKYGQNAEKILFLGAIGATVCYLTAALTNAAWLGLIACGLTGFCVSMLWPGSLIIASERIPTGGVFLYAMMAAGGDLGASVGPQLVGVVTDGVMANASAVQLAQKWGLTLEQLGMKFGMLVGMLFPLIAIFLYLRLLRTRKKAQTLPLQS
ncbi:MAG: MFS transporter [Clostridia bacterium]|nr:MFS transporter [Clostridia bacterium]